MRISVHLRHRGLQISAHRWPAVDSPHSWYRRVIVDERALLNARRIAIRFVVHLIGDIHQPLHAGHKKDRGGNRIFVEYKGSKVKLHKLWGTSLIEEEEQGSPSEIARRLDEGVTADDRQAWQARPVDQ